MNIKTKFKVGQEVYVIFKEDNEPFVKIFDDVITEITISKDGIVYYLTKIVEEFKEDELVSKKDVNALIPKIRNFLKENSNEGE